MSDPRNLRVFLCHASQDKPVVRELYRLLLTEGWIDPWLDEEKLLPGQDWDMEIEKAVESADSVIVCVSNASVSKEGYIQRELRFVLDIALEKPEQTIFIVPLRLDECELPRRLRSWQYLDYFPEDQRQKAYQKLLQSLRIRLKDAGTKKPAQAAQTSPPRYPGIETRLPAAPAKETESLGSSPAASQSKASTLELGGTISLIIFFLLTSYDLFVSTGNTINYLVAACALLGGIFLFSRRQIPALSAYKYPAVVYLLAYSLNDYYFYDENQLVLIMIAVSALACSGLLALTFRSPKKIANYSALFLAIFLLFYGGSMFLNLFEIYPPAILGLVISVITSFLLFMDV